MTEENNVIDATDKFGPWEGNVDENGQPGEPVDISPEEYESAMAELFANADLEQLGRTISGVLEFLTMRAVQDTGYYIETDDKRAITVIAAGEDADAIRAALPEHFKSWEDEMETPTEDSEQDEPAAEQE